MESTEPTTKLDQKTLATIYGGIRGTVIEATNNTLNNDFLEGQIDEIFLETKVILSDSEHKFAFWKMGDTSTVSDLSKGSYICIRKTGDDYALIAYDNDNPT